MLNRASTLFSSVENQVLWQILKTTNGSNFTNARTMFYIFFRVNSCNSWLKKLPASIVKKQGAASCKKGFFIIYTSGDSLFTQFHQT